MAENPDPTIRLRTLAGVERSVDDWTTMFHLCLVILPDRAEAAEWVPVAERIFAVLGDSDCRTAFVVTADAEIARRILGPAAERHLVFCDPDRALVRGLGLRRLPAIVHLRQDTSVGAAAEGWDPREWQEAVREVAREMAWSVPDVAPPGAPLPAISGWDV